MQGVLAGGKGEGYMLRRGKGAGSESFGRRFFLGNGPNGGNDFREGKSKVKEGRRRRDGGSRKS